LGFGPGLSKTRHGITAELFLGLIQLPLKFADLGNLDDARRCIHDAIEKVESSPHQEGSVRQCLPQRRDCLSMTVCDRVSLAARTTATPNLRVLRAHVFDRPRVASGKCAHTRLVRAAPLSCVSSRERRCRHGSPHSGGRRLPLSLSDRSYFYFFARVLISQGVSAAANYPYAAVTICSIPRIAGQRANSSSRGLYRIERVGTC
jgi:hypothetical protein